MQRGENLEREQNTVKSRAHGHPDGLELQLSFLDFSFYSNSEMWPGQCL